MKKLFAYLLCFLCLHFTVKAQDPQFSQFYAAPLYINPAFAGSLGIPRVALTHRNQWPSLTANFVSTLFSGDVYFDRYNSGLGVTFLADQQFSQLKTNSVNLQYSYRLRLKNGMSINAGMQGGYTSTGANFSNYTFGDQLQAYLATGVFPKSIDPYASNISSTVNYTDISSGAMLYSGKFWFSVSAHHLNTPNVAFTSQDARLPIKYGLQAGYKIRLGEEEEGYYGRAKSITPVLHYKRQGLFEQLDIGTYFNYGPFALGAWYRGIPFKKLEQSSTVIYSRDAAVVLLGYTKDDFSIGYSYDITISSLGSTGGSHELSLSYLFSNLIPEAKRRVNKKETACPKF